MTANLRIFSLQGAACSGLVLLLMMSIWAYLPGLTGGYLLDDNASLFNLQLLRDSPDQILDYVSGDRSGPIGRQVSLVTFSLEQLYTDASAATLKRHNILLHHINGALVFWLAYLIFSWRHMQFAGLLALLSAALWTLAPLQVSTVLYAVQRMAMLSTTLVLLALISYLKWRIRAGSGKSGLQWLGMAILFAAIAPFAKENGVLALPLILLLEVSYLRGQSITGVKFRGFLSVATWLLVFLFVVAVVGVMQRWDGLTAGYASRSFTVTDRLLTQPTILWDYVLQFYMPDIRRMGVYHDDFPVSSTLELPVTLYNIAAWIGIIIASVTLFIKKRGSTLVYCVLFFLAAHSIESSFLALEMYFEHRNYLPSVALALLPSALLSTLLPAYRVVLMPLLAWGAIYAMYLLIQTATLTQVWSSSTLLMIHHYAAHPDSSRANDAMASRLAELGDYGAAISYAEAAFKAAKSQKSARPVRVGDYHLKNIALACLAQHPMPRDDLARLSMQNPERPLADSNLLTIINRMATTHRCPAMDWGSLGEQFASIYLDIPRPDRASHAVYTSLAAFSNGLQRYDRAYQYTSLALMLKPSQPQTLLMHLHFSAAIAADSEYDMTMSKLLKLCQAGSLTMEQERTLTLYQGEKACGLQ